MEWLLIFLGDAAQLARAHPALGLLLGAAAFYLGVKR